ncbi:MAG: response regulator [Gammaproteobacteria bacterium]|nr:response regulator [Gammaproteobacteria bacterium]
MRILLVEDDNLLGSGLLTGLKNDGYSVDWVKKGTAAFSAITTTPYDAVILDIGLPEMSGLEVLSKARNKGITTPILILTAQDTISDRVTGLDTGADDYLTKPFDLDELYARLRALTRRSRGLSSQVIQYKHIIIDPSAHSVISNDKTIELSRREFSLLTELVSSAGRVLSRSFLEEKLYNWDSEVESNTIEVYIHHLRKKFGSDIIKTIRGVGYTVPKE